MFKKIYNIIKKYFAFKADSKERLKELFTTSLLARVSLLPLPFFAAKIIDYVTNKEYNTAIIFALLFGMLGITAIFFRNLNYKAYRKHCIYTHNKLQDMIVEKVTTYDEDFSRNISKSFIINTTFQDIGNVMQIPDMLFDSINYFINILISIFVLLKVNFIIGLIMIGVIIFSLCYVVYNLQYREHYLMGQRKYQDKISSLLGEVLDGGVEIQAFNMEKDINKYLDKYNNLWRKNYFKKRNYQDRVYVVSDTFIQAFKILLYIVFSILILKGHYSIATLVLVIGYVEDCEDYFWKIKTKIENVSGMTTRVERIHKLLNYNQKNMNLYGENGNDYIEGSIEFKNVSMKYDNMLVSVE